MGSMQPFDLIVVGAGGSGLACAAAASERGARVLVLEKCSRVGGTTGIAIGSFTACGTRLQASEGIFDDPVTHAVDAGLFGPSEYQQRNNDQLRQFFLQHSADTLHWLMDMGLVFHGPNPEPPNRVSRMHNVVPNAKAYIAAMHSRFLKHGGTLVCNARVESLLTEQHRVCGVVACVDGRTASFSATVGVVLAAGDYANSADMIGRFKGPRFEAIEGINSHATGDGHRLAEQAGARMVNMDITYGPELRFVPSRHGGFEQLIPSRGIAMRLVGRCLPWVPQWILQRLIKRLLVTWQHPEDALFADGAILINEQGKRFCDELKSPEREIAIAAQVNKRAYILLDERLCQLYSAWPKFISTAPEIAYAYVQDYLKLRPDIAITRQHIEQLCVVRGLPIKALQETLTATNAARQVPLQGCRWCLLGPVKAYFTTTEGGSAINTQMQVLDQSSNPIPGLFAIGQNGLGGMVLWGHGLHIAWAITSGRLTGQSLAAQVR